MSPSYLLRLFTSEADLQVLWDRINAWKQDGRSDPRRLRELALGARVDVVKYSAPDVAVFYAEGVEYVRDDHVPCEGLCAHFPWPAKRPFFDLPLPEGAHVTEMEIISASGRPVYLAKSLARDGQLATVVVKIYQASTVLDDLTNPAHKGILYHKDFDVFDRWRRTLLGFRNEIFAYERLASVQGSLVPYLYGVFEVTLPTGEPAIALVMEYIPEDLIDIDTAISDDERRPEILNTFGLGMMGATHAITNLLVTHSDLQRRNVLWPANNCAEGNCFGNSRPIRFPVIIDFEHASPFTLGIKFSTLLAGLETLSNLRQDARKRPLGFDMKTFATWLESKMQTYPEINEMYDEYERSIRSYFRNAKGERQNEEEEEGEVMGFSL